MQYTTNKNRARLTVEWRERMNREAFRQDQNTSTSDKLHA